MGSDLIKLLHYSLLEVTKDSELEVVDDELNQLKN